MDPSPGADSKLLYHTSYWSFLWCSMRDTAYYIPRLVHTVEYTVPVSGHGLLHTKVSVHCGGYSQSPGA